MTLQTKMAVRIYLTLRPPDIPLAWSGRVTLTHRSKVTATVVKTDPVSRTKDNGSRIAEAGVVYLNKIKQAMRKKHSSLSFVYHDSIT